MKYCNNIATIFHPDWNAVKNIWFSSIIYYDNEYLSYLLASDGLYQQRIFDRIRALSHLVGRNRLVLSSPFHLSDFKGYLDSTSSLTTHLVGPIIALIIQNTECMQASISIFLETGTLQQLPNCFGLFKNNFLPLGAVSKDKAQTQLRQCQ